MKFYYTYKITLLKGSFTGHYYYGQHITSNINDGYCGSGTKLINYYNKYGKKEGETYIKEIIQFYNNEDELNEAEYELIGDKYENDEMCINLVGGGKGGSKSSETKEKLRQKTLLQFKDEAKKELHRQKTIEGMHKEDNWERYIESVKNRDMNGEKNPFYGKKHKPEVIEKDRQAHLGKKYSEETKQKHRDKVKNRIWIHLNDNEKWIDKDYLDYWLDDGWSIGRK